VQNVNGFISGTNKKDIKNKRQTDRQTEKKDRQTDRQKERKEKTKRLNLSEH